MPFINWMAIIWLDVVNVFFFFCFFMLNVYVFILFVHVFFFSDVRVINTQSDNYQKTCACDQYVIIFTCMLWEVM